jgi:hypothetical protein
MILDEVDWQINHSTTLSFPREALLFSQNIAIKIFLNISVCEIKPYVYGERTVVFFIERIPCGGETQYIRVLCGL